MSFIDLFYRSDRDSQQLHGEPRKVCPAGDLESRGAAVPQQAVHALRRPVRRLQNRVLDAMLEPSGAESRETATGRAPHSTKGG